MPQSKKIKPNIIKLVSLVLFFCLFTSLASAADATPPTGSISINNNAAYTNSINVTLNLSATDTGSGVAQMKFSNNNSTWSSPEPYATTKSWILSTGSGTKKVYVKYQDNAGNWSRAYSDSIILDTTLPTGSIQINKGAAKTNSTTVTLNLSASDKPSGVSQMQLSNDNSTWSSPESYVTTKTWSIPAGDGTKTVYVKFRDKAANWSTAYSDTIILDTTAPVISNVGASEISSNSAKVSWNTDEPATAQVEYGLTAAYGYKSSVSETLATSLAVTISNLKEYTLYHYRAISKDSVGNQAVSDDYTFTTTDATPPTGSIKINNGATSTDNINVFLNLSAQDTGSGVSQMKFSNNNSTWSSPESYNTTKAWVLSSGGGIKRVYVKFKDNSENWSSTYSDSIILLNQAPQVGTVSPVFGTSVPDEAVNFSTTYSDTNGWQDIRYAGFLINTSTSGANCAYLYYDQNYNKFYLRNDSNTSWLGGYAPGSSYVIENSYAKLDCSQTTVVGDNTVLTVNWTVTFKSAFIGTKNTYLYVKDDKNAYTNWTTVGTWNVQTQTDTIAPTGTITINNNADYTNTPSVNLALSAQDNAGGSGLSQMQFSNDNSTWSAPEIYSTTKAWTIDSIEGLRTVYVKYKDVAGNWSESFFDTIILDTVAPAKPTVGPPTSPTNVNLQTLSGTKEANTSIWINGAEVTPINNQILWSYEVNLIEGTNNFSITSKDVAGNESEAVVVTIILDTTAPNPPQGLSAVAGDTKVDLSWAANTEPDLSGYNIYRSTVPASDYTKINTSLINTTAYQDTSLTNGTTHYYVVTALDNAGNESDYSNEASATPPGHPTETEPNNDFSSANTINLNSSINGTINPTGDQDYFKITTTESGVISISLTNVPNNIDAVIDFFDSNYNYIGEAYGDMGSNIYLQQQLTSASDYYILVYDQGNDSSSTLPYRLEVKFSTFGLYYVEIWPQYISPNADGINDEAYLYASITAPSNWTVNIKDASNNIKRSFTGTGTDINEVWDGKDADGHVVSEGVYTYIIEATDLQTGASATCSRQVTVDNTLPTATITEPTSGQTLSGTVAIRGTADDVNFNYGYLYYGQGTSPTSWNYITEIYSKVGPDPGLLANWNTATIPNGDYTIRLEVWDGAGNVKRLDLPVKLYNVIWNVQVYPEYISPNNDGQQDSTTITAQLISTANWTLNIKDSSNNIIRSFTGTGTDINEVWDGKDTDGHVVSDGVYTYSIETIDPATGSIATYSGTVTVDNTLPTATITEPTSGQTLSGTIAIRGIADDLNFNYGYLYYGQGTSPTEWGWIDGIWYKVGPDPGLLANWNTATIPNGDYTIRLEVWDRAGNVKRLDLPVKLYNVNIYNAYASPNYFSPNGDGQQDTTTITASITASCNWTINIKDPSNNIKQTFTGTGSSISQAWDGKDSGNNIVPDGAYTYTIDATDPATGTPAPQVSGTVTVDNTLPTATITEPASGATLSGTVAIKGTADDLNFSYGYLYYGQGTSPTEWNWIDGIWYKVGPDPGLLANWNTATTSNGDYVLRLGVYDRAGNVKTVDLPVKLYNMNIYNAYASPDYFSPNGDGQQDTTTITASITASCNWTINIKDPSNNIKQTFSGSGSTISKVWNGKDSGNNIVPDGTYTYTIDALDPATGSTAPQVSGTVTVDNTLPTGSITEPTSGQTLSGTVEIKGIADDLNFSYGYLYYGQGTSPTEWNWIDGIWYKVGPDPGLLANWNTATIPNGDYTIKLEVRDRAGNVTDIDVPVYISHPGGHFAAPTPFSPNGDGILDTTAVVANFGQIANWTISIKDASAIEVRSFGGTDEKIVQIWDGKDAVGVVVPDGVYTYYLEALDPATSGVILQGSGNVEIDNTSPIAEITSPTASQVVSGTVPIVGTASDGNLTSYTVEYGVGETPTEWTAIHTSSSPVTNDVLANWETNDLSNGVYTIRLRASDIVDHTSSDSVTVTVDNIKITNVSINPEVFNPSHNEKININYTIDRDADITITIQDLSYNAIATLGPNPKLIGTNTDVWNGKDNANNIVADDAYTFTIEATNGTRFEEYTPEYIPAAVGLTSFAVNDTFDPHNNQLCQINYNLADYAQVLIRVERGGIWTIVDWKPRAFGSNTDYWNGRDSNGNIVDPNTATIAIWTRALPDNPIIVVSELTVSISTDPYSIIPSYREFTTITYTISETANVTVSLYYPDGTLVKTLEEAVNKPAATYELSWDGTDSTGKVVSQEGNFTVKVEATDEGGKTTTALGNISVY